MSIRSFAFASTVLASAGLIATAAHAAPKFDASSYSLSSGADSSTQSDGAKIIDWIMTRFVFTIEFDSQLGAKDTASSATKHPPSTAEECDEKEQQTASSSSAADAETAARTSPTGPEPLYLAF